MNGSRDTSDGPGYVDWPLWDNAIANQGIEIERPHGSPHPDHPSIIYPIDYGFVRGTISADGHAVDIFVGSDADAGLVAAIFTVDHRKGDREVKLIFNCTPEEVYLVNGFINFDPDLMTGRLLMRRPMKELWSRKRRI
ncbi:MAG: hypothetical protein HKN17_05015 [Rhodothermales bacterium]|nr:hypothetical protein [Rhodothermales bacterium]